MKLGDSRIQKKGHIVIDDIGYKKLTILENAMLQQDLWLAWEPAAESFKRLLGELSKLARSVALELGDIGCQEEQLGKARRKAVLRLTGNLPDDFREPILRGGFSR